ncbi:hypothetical protein WMF38_57520 [Sorangium sp. So ce118]
MAVVSGTVTNVTTLEGFAGSVQTLQVAQVLFTLSGTYAQADNGILSSVNTAIQNSRRNGKTVTLVDAMCGWQARKATDPATFLALNTVAVSTNDITFQVTNNNFTSEFTDATALPETSTPFCLLVSFTEA